MPGAGWPVASMLSFGMVQISGGDSSTEIVQTGRGETGQVLIKVLLIPSIWMYYTSFEWPDLALHVHTKIVCENGVY